MRIYRGPNLTLEEDYSVLEDIIQDAIEHNEIAIRVWQPPKHLAFGKRDINHSNYEIVKEIAKEQAFPPRERRVGGRAVPYTGETVAFMKVIPVSDFRERIQDRYDECLTDLQQALWRLGVPVLRGEPADSFCPGSYSLSYNGKIAGLAQRVRTDVAIVGGLIVVSHQEEFSEILEAIYPKLDLAFDPTSVGSIAAAGGTTNWNRIQSTLEEKLSHNAEPTVIDLSKNLSSK